MIGTDRVLAEVTRLKKELAASQAKVEGLESAARFWQDKAGQANDRLAESQARIAEQLITIQALNTIIGGEGSLTTDNIIQVGRLETRIKDLQDACHQKQESLNAAEPDRLFMLQTRIAKLSALARHSDSCSWITPLPTGIGYWGCDCGLSNLVLDGEPIYFKEVL